MAFNLKFDVIVVGGGHAGTEAALASARMGSKTLLLTHNIETLGQMSCNPAIGGIGKTHLVKEVDALGGVMASAADHAGIQFRTLNAGKGPAVRATRAQADRLLYKTYIRRILENQTNLTLFQQAVDDLIVENDSVKGVKTQMGLEFYANSVVLTVGTFLGGKIHIGLNHYQGGRAGDPPANALAVRLREFPFKVERLKTGTPPRLDGRTINWGAIVEQASERPSPVMSYWGEVSQHPEQVSCYITHTNVNTHEIILQGLEESPLFTGKIEGIGPRYCPSIEDKIFRFRDRDSHQIFLEPEGLTTHEVYPNGISTSLAFDTQIKLVNSIVGLENTHITRPGYAIEYDFFDPRDLKSSLETKYLQGLFFAGQINGTTGYEEAAAQGLIAGINASQRIKDQEPWTPRRDQAYIGVLIDDLITRGTNEPYRMFTSRAEYRLSLRQDNADFRLTEQGWKMGLINDEKWAIFCKKREDVEKESQRLRQCWIRPETPAAKAFEAVFQKNLEREYSVWDLLRRPEIKYSELMVLEAMGPGVSCPKVAEQIDIQAKYSGYLARQEAEVAKQMAYEEHNIPYSFEYEQIPGLSAELKQKLAATKPETIAQAKRIPGITPAAISLILIYLKKAK